jgi:serine/threonine-protein kinase
LLQAERRFARLERAYPNDPAILLAQAWNAYIGYGNASGLPERAADAAHFVTVARQTTDRLLSLDSNDHALQSFAANIRQLQSQALSGEGRYAEAIAVQREVIALHNAALGPGRRAVALNRLATSHITMGGIARVANNRALTCESYRAAQAHVTELRRRNELLGAVESMRERLDANVARCARNAPLSTLAVFD